MTDSASNFDNRQSRSVRSDVVWMMSGTGLRGLSQWGIMFLLVKLTNPSVVGQYGLALTLALPVMIFSTLSLTRLQGSDAVRTYSFGDYSTMRIAATVAAVTIVGMIVVVSDPGTSVLILTLAITCQIGVLNLLEVFHGLFLQQSRLDTLGQGMIYSNLSIFIAVASALWLGFDISIAILLSILSLAIPLVSHYLPATRSIVQGRPDLNISTRLKWRATKQVALFRIALPLGLSMLVVSLGTTVPRYFLVADDGQFELGVLVALLSMLAAGALFAEAIVQTALPRLSQLYATGNLFGLNKTLRTLIVVASGLGLFIIVAAWFAGPNVVAVVLSPEYATYRFAIVGLACVFTVELVTRIVALAVTIARIIDPLLIGNVVALGIAIVVSWMLVPEYGVEGAVATLIVTSLVRLGLFSLLWLRHIGWLGSRPVSATTEA